MDRGSLTGTIFLDLIFKAYDTISHGVLLKKLNSYSANGSELLWFKDYLFQKSQCAVVKESASNLLAINNGVP